VAGASSRLLAYGQRQFRATSASIAEMAFGAADGDDVCCVVL